MRRLTMSKKSHNKKRNVGIIYSLLLKTAAAGLVEGNVSKQNKAQTILKRFFSPGTELHREWKLFSALSEPYGADGSLATRILGEAKTAAGRHNKHILQREKNKCIKDINYSFGADFWKQRVDDYTKLATVGQLLENWRSPADQRDIAITTKYEAVVHGILMETKEVKTLQEEKIPEADGLVVKLMIEKFNQKYSKTMTPLQQKLIKSYIFSDDNPTLFVKLVEAVQKRAVQSLEDYKYQCDNDIVLSKIDEVRSQIAEVNAHDISDDNLAKFLKIVDLTEEIRS